MLPYSASEVSITIDGPSDIPAGFKAFFTVDIQGAFYSDYVEFGDGQTGIHSAIRPLSHIWTAPGTYNMVISAFDENNQQLKIVTKTITVFAADFNTIYVKPNGNDIADGRSWGTAKQTIQAGIDEQELPGGQVVVADGVYAINSTLLVDKEIQLIGLNGAEHTILDGGSTNRYTGVMCLDIADNHTTVRGITFRNGNDRNSNKYYSGGGVFCNYSLSPRLFDCMFEGNRATEGGAMAYGTAIDCVFSNNTAISGKGGGLYLSHAINCDVTANTARDAGGGMYGGTADNCTFTKNRTYTTGSSYGNGAGMSHGTANECRFIQNDSNGYGGGMNESTANDCQFIGNSAVHGGGGLRNSEANRCSFMGNISLTTGGGIQSGTANSCSFSGNQASTSGGASAYASLNHCTLIGNSADGTGGGMVSGAVRNSIIWGNTAPTHPNFDNINNVYNSCSPDVTHDTQGCITNNPLLISASHISAASPCIGKGNVADATGNGYRW